MARCSLVLGGAGVLTVLPVAGDVQLLADGRFYVGAARTVGDRVTRRRAGLAVCAGVVTTLALAACTSGSGAESGATGSAAVSASSGPTDVVALETAYERLIGQVLPSVVEIRTDAGLGSGVIYDDKGDVVTNAHVVGSSTRFEVYVSGHADPVAATLVGVYRPDDLAVIRMESPPALTPATFGKDGDVRVGEIVLAMGNPLGLSSSVTNGIISAIARTVSEPGENGRPGATIPNMIQTSASINPGNSGGALVNLRGEVVGIPTLAATSPNGGAAPGIGLAISAQTVRLIAPQLIRSGKVTDSGRAALGVTVTSVADGSGKPGGVGVVAVQASGGARAAGIRRGDVIVEVAGTPTPTPQALATVLAKQKVGSHVPVTLRRGSDRTKVTVTLGKLP